jgi:hypothetical protein
MNMLSALTVEDTLVESQALGCQGPMDLKPEEHIVYPEGRQEGLINDVVE